MIRRPAQAAGLDFERHLTTDSALDETLRDTTVRSPEALPLLEFALDQLYERRTVVGGRLTWAAYEEIGGLEGALASAAEEALHALRSWQQETFDHVMGGLVTLGTGTREELAHRRTADYEVLARPPGAKALVDCFVEARLFVADKDTAGHAIVSVAHEALLARKALPQTSTPAAGTSAPLTSESTRRPWQWARLGAWVEANADFLRMRARVAASLKQWQDAGEEASFLLPTGRALLDGETLMHDHPQALSTEEQTYIVRSIAAEAGRRRQRARVRAVVMTGLSLLAFAAGIGALFGFAGKHEAQTQAKIAEARTTEAKDKKQEAEKQAHIAQTEIAKSNAQIHLAALSDLATARSLLEKKNWREAVAYLRRAQKYNDPVSKTAGDWLWSEIVYGTGDRDTLPECLLVHSDEVLSAAYSPDGTRIVTACRDNTAWQWEATSGKPIGEPLRHEDTVTSAAYSPDGTRIVTACRDHTARQWEVASGKPIGEPLHHESPVSSAAYSPDGTRIVTACEDHTARQWEVASGKTHRRAAAPQEPGHQRGLQSRWHAHRHRLIGQHRPAVGSNYW